MARSYPSLSGEKGHYVDYFPELWAILAHPKRLEKDDRPLSPLHFWVGATGKIWRIVENIQEENGPYAIKNHRIVEWVVMQVLSAILEQKKYEWLVDYSLWLSYFEADLLYHVDVMMSARTQKGTSYFTIDLTLWVQKIVEKIFAHSRWKNNRPNFLIWKRNFAMPHLILYTDPNPSEWITLNIEKACANKTFRTRKEIQDAIRSYVESLPSPPLWEILIATPDRWNIGIQTPHHREIITDLTHRLGAERYDRTSSHR
jgi:hypothetical protein